MSTQQQQLCGLNFSEQWRDATAPDGKKYFYNVVTQETSWEQPVSISSEHMQADTDLPPLWTSVWSVKGHKYFVHVVTGEIMQSKPKLTTSETVSGGGDSVDVKEVIEAYTAREEGSLLSSNKSNAAGDKDKGGAGTKRSAIQASLQVKNEDANKASKISNIGQSREGDKNGESSTATNGTDGDSANRGEATLATNKKKKKSRPRWMRTKYRTSLYVKGLPAEITDEEIATFFSKCGIIVENEESGKPRAKAYRNEETGLCKGDGIVHYLKPESVQLAQDILQGIEIRPGYPVDFELAQLKKRPDKPEAEEEGDGPKLTDNSKAIGQKKLRKRNNVKLSWAEGTAEVGGMKIVVIKNVFGLEEASEPEFKKELSEDLLAECSKRCGHVDKVTVFERNPEGVVAVKFKDAEAAEKCVQLMDGRFFARRKLVSHFWDGVTNYKIEEDPTEASAAREADEEERLSAFNAALDAMSSTDSGEDSSDYE